MNPLIPAIERFERALHGNDASELDEAEQSLRIKLLSFNADRHDAVCEPQAEGCVEGIEYRGTVFAAGFSEQGRPIVILMRRVTQIEAISPRMSLATH